ncbi:MAG TPA: S8 family serine peptidase, partial [Saprospiraceae bacterium]|nr:S8 family serine peptidase [Saprospiraceae bacterium]
AIVNDYSGRFRSPVRIEKTLSKRMGIYLMAFDHGRIHEGELLSDLRNNRKILVAQYDHITTNRNEPNDPRFSDQWQWLNTGQTGGLVDSDTDADLAWDITQGGVTALGDTIVVAIIDDGLNYEHPDIAANTWINRGEIRDNGIDDDDNGYIDDVFGWNVYDDNPEVLNQGHGLSVAGMIGAVGNNGTGITGINWHVKLMTIVGGTPESSAIASYSYALEQRILYHESNGERGAFVVSTNSSWGIDYGQPADAPLWCAFYDSLGVHGILSAAATANNPDNIDLVGDLPTACTSEYLLSVTALNSANERTFSAFGTEHVDFGAPGEDVYTTRGSEGYGTSTGTSFASPVAAGFVALLYSAPVLSVAQLAHSDPAAAARFIRDMIFYGVEKVPALESETKFGGALNMWKSLSLLLALSADCPIPFGITSEVISDEEVIIDWITLDTADAINARYKPLAAIDWDTLLNVQRPLTLTGLTGCTEYVVEFESICADTSTGFQSSHEFKTDGCCELPATINLTSDATNLFADWSHVLAAEYYLIQWRVQGQTEWNEEVTSLDHVTLSNLEGCTFYEFRLQTNCDTTETGFSDVMTIRTRNCGNCIDLVYCEAGSDNAFEEFIDSVVIGPLVNDSGSNDGYAFFEDLNPVYNAGDDYPVLMKPGFGTFEEFDEQFRIWLDANQDGVFEQDELLLDTFLLEGDSLLVGEISIPADAINGSTRMRVSMAYFNPPFVADQEPCGILDFGEVEDYCVTILQANNTCPRVDTVLFDAIDFSGAFMYWPSAEGAIAYTYRYRIVGEPDYTELATVDTTANIDGLEECTAYEFQIRTVCIIDTTSYDSVYILVTECNVAVKDVDPLLSQFNVYPNPVNDYAVVSLKPFESGAHTLSIFNLQGQIMFSTKIFADSEAVTEVEINNLEKFPPGLFLIVVEKDGILATKKLIKL